MTKMPLALVVTSNQICLDPVVQKEIYWLKEVGWRVITFSPSIGIDSEVQNIPIQSKSTLSIWISRIFIRNQGSRWNFLYGNNFKSPDLLQVLSDADLVINNDLDFLPGLVAYKENFLKHGKSFYLHNHLYELFHSSWPGWRWKLFRKRSQKFLNTYIGNPQVDGWSTVNEPAARDYEHHFPGLSFSHLLNTAWYQDKSPSNVDPENIALVYVGAAGPDRSLETLIDAVQYLDSRFNLHFVINGIPEYVEHLKSIASSSEGRITVHNPVQMRLVPDYISQFDLSLIYFPPINKNIEFTLGNKFFQSIQARLGIVIGKSPAMSPLVSEYKLGPIVDGWGPIELANTLNALSSEDIREYKGNSDQIALEFSTEQQLAQFQDAITNKVELSRRVS
jgi:hypothetical protein